MEVAVGRNFTYAGFKHDALVDLLPAKESENCTSFRSLPAYQASMTY
jgi:hypothetical protein